MLRKNKQISLKKYIQEQTAENTEHVCVCDYDCGCDYLNDFRWLKKMMNLFCCSFHSHHHSFFQIIISFSFWFVLDWNNDWAAYVSDSRLEFQKWNTTCWITIEFLKSDCNFIILQFIIYFLNHSGEILQSNGITLCLVISIVEFLNVNLIFLYGKS